MNEIVTNEKKNVFGNVIKISSIIIALCLCCVVSFIIGKNAQIEERELQQSIELNKDLNTLKSQIEDAKTELDSQKTLIEELNQYKNQKDEKQAELSQLDNDISTKSEKSASLDLEISNKTAELDKLKNLIQKTGEEPKVLGAGHYTVGIDIPAGRYVVTGDSNFVVRSLNGRLKVNTILGGGRFGEESYTCTLDDGDTLELSSKDTFTPVK